MPEFGNDKQFLPLDHASGDCALDSFDKELLFLVKGRRVKVALSNINCLLENMDFFNWICTKSNSWHLHPIIERVVLLN